MILNYTEILALLHSGVVERAEPEQVNGTSLDVTLGDVVLVEKQPHAWRNGYHVPVARSVSLREREALQMEPVNIGKEGGYVLDPGEFILAATRERFNLPLGLSAEYKLKSSMARLGLNHLNAGWCDPGWHGSVLTLELVNTSRYHSILLQPGDRIGQLVFFPSREVPLRASYKVRGAYNGDGQVQGAKPPGPTRYAEACTTCGSAYHPTHECSPAAKVLGRIINEQEK